MAQLTRSTKVNGSTTLASNTLARATDVETDMLTLFNAHNNHDTAVSAWTAVTILGNSTVPLTADNSTGTQNIANFKDNGTSVVSIADGGIVTATAVATSGTTLTVTAANGGTGVPLVANNGTSTGNILELKDNGTTALSVADGGTVTVAPGGTTKAVINSTGLTMSNSATIAMGSAKITGLAAGTANGDAVRFEQIYYGFQTPIQSTLTTTFGTTSATFQATGLTATITPTSASHRIRITVNGGMLRNTRPDLSRGLVTICRGGSNILAANGATGNATSALASGLDTAIGFVYIDSPASTSALTYEVYVKSADNVGSTVTFNIQSQTTSIILEEIV